MGCNTCIANGGDQTDINELSQQQSEPEPQFPVESQFTYIGDAQGSIRLFRNDLSQWIASYAYDAYGNRYCNDPHGPTACDAGSPFGYAGQYTDEESGLQYLRARYYDPSTEQFITRDPNEAETGQPYTYAWGNPVNFVDPAGMAGQSKEGQQLWLPKFNRPNAAKWEINYGRFDKQNRPTGIRATLTKALLSKNSGTRANPKISPPGWVKGALNRARGHLLGKQLGGSGDDPRNLVTMVHNPVNNSTMKSIENAVKKAVNEGETVEYSVTPIYRGTEDVPAGFRIRARGSGGLDINEPISNRDP